MSILGPERQWDRTDTQALVITVGILLMCFVLPWYLSR